MDRIGQPSHTAWQTLTKVPKITLYFWVIKILTTAMGEAISDYAVYKYNPYFVVILGFFVFSIALLIQFSKKRYVPWAYWLAVSMVAVFGTMAADVIHIQFGVPYIASTAFFALALLVIFSWWHRAEKTLSFHSIYTRRREVFYWAAVLATFAMGTAAGDLTAYTFHFGFLKSGVIFGIVFAMPAIGYWLFRLNSIFAFWFAYVMTRPFGASFADWFGKSKAVGGLNYGDGKVSIILIALVVLLITYLSASHADEYKSQTRESKWERT